MTPEQRKMARHALGLVDGRKMAYRNRYVAGLGTTQEAAWDDLVRQGFAKRGENGIAVVGFSLTVTGAKAVLEQGERLDDEDFPAAAVVLQERGTPQ